MAMTATCVLPAPVGKHDDAASARGLPGGEGIGLERSRLAVHAHAGGQREVTRRVVFDGDTGLTQRFDEVEIRDGGRAIAGFALVPGERRRQRGGPLGEPSQLKGACAKHERWHGRVLARAYSFFMRRLRRSGRMSATKRSA